MNWQEKIFSISNEQSFEQLALEIYRYQIEHCAVYSSYVNYLNRQDPQSILEIPFLPISLFKTNRIIAENCTEQLLFKSSGTTDSARSSHYIADPKLYKASFIRAFTHFIKNPKETVILALLPNYLEQGESSLVYMVDELMRLSNSDLSGYVLNDPWLLQERYVAANAEGKKVVVFGVTYALLDLATFGVNISQAIIIETGGMKGKRKELPKETVHSILTNSLGVTEIYSEYGMTEMLSQAYSVSDQVYKCPPWLKILTRDMNDPFTFVLPGKTGGINVIDLANIYSCSFIATQDLGKIVDEGFKIMGRFDHSDTRGCNLMIE